MPCFIFCVNQRRRARSNEARSGEASSASSWHTKSREGSREKSKERPGERTRARSSSSSARPHNCHHAIAVELHESQWRSFGLFDGLNQAQLDKTVSRMVVKNYHDGDKIISKGSIGTTVIYVYVYM
jgi:muconolactone delta-isomerase